MSRAARLCTSCHATLPFTYLRPIASAVAPFPLMPLRPHHRPHLLCRRLHILLLLRRRAFPSVSSPLPFTLPPPPCHRISSASSFHENRIKEERSVQTEEVTKKTKASAAVVCISDTASSTAAFPTAMAFHPPSLSSLPLPPILPTNERIKQEYER